MAKYSDSYSYSEKLAHRRYVILLVLLFVVLIVVYHATYNFLFRTYRLESDSMEPTISAGSFITMTPMYDVETVGKRGDIVLRKQLYDSDLPLFKNLVNHLCSFFTFRIYKPFDASMDAAEKTSFCRIVGMPGDTIYLEDSVLHIKEAGSSHFLTEFELCEVDYDIVSNFPLDSWDNSLPFSSSFEEFTLKSGEYFLMFDNRSITSDSRMLGPATKDQIIGKTLFRYFPFNKIGPID